MEVDIVVGISQILSVARFSEYGAYLQALQAESSDHSKSTRKDDINNARESRKRQDKAKQVLLPNKFCPKNLKLNDKIEVFIYTDSADRIVATIQKPKAQYGEFAKLNIVDRNEFGAFLDLGLDKHIFMPCNGGVKIGESIFCYIDLDKQGRLIARKNIKNYLKAYKNSFKDLNLKVKIQAFESTKLGIGCIVSGAYYGLLYHSELPSGLNLDNLPESALIKRIRADGKLDLKLELKSSESIKQKLLDSMPLSLHFDSTPQEIFATLGISKKAFKRYINELVKNKQITFDRQNLVFKKM